MSTETKLPVLSRSAARLKLAREWHLYLGTLFAPSIIFFAFTGALQLFSLHEGRPGGTYQPPVWIQKLASIHKNQNIAEKHWPPPGARGGQNAPPQRAAGEQKGPPAPDEAGRPPQGPEGDRAEGDHHEEEGGSKIPTYLLKWFFTGTALGLISSTLLGIYMAFKFNRSRTLVWGMLIIGTAVPVALIAMMA